MYIETFNTIYESNIFDKIIMSSDDEDILQFFNNFKFVGDAQVLIHTRHGMECEDDAKIIDVVRQVYLDIEETPDYTCIIYPTAVFVTKEILLKAKEKIEKSRLNCCFPIIQEQQPDNKKLDVIEFDGNEYVMPLYFNSHDKQSNVKRWYHASQFFYFKTKECLHENKIVGELNEFVEMYDYQAQDINDEKDFKIAKMKYYIMKRLEND